MKFFPRVSVNLKQNVWLTEIINVNMRGNLAMTITHDYTKPERTFFFKIKSLILQILKQWSVIKSIFCILSTLSKEVSCRGDKQGFEVSHTKMSKRFTIEGDLSSKTTKLTGRNKINRNHEKGITLICPQSLWRNGAQASKLSTWKKKLDDNPISNHLNCCLSIELQSWIG